MRLAMHEWTMAAVSFDGKLQRNFINGVEAEQAVCKGAIAQTKLENSLRIGARGGQHCCGASRKACCHLGVKHKGDSVSHKGSWSQFVGDIDEVMLYSSNHEDERIVWAPTIHCYCQVLILI